MAVKNVGTIYNNVDVGNSPDTYFTLKLNSAVRTGKNVKYTFYAYATLASSGSYRCDSAGLQIKVNSSYAINDSTWKPSKSGSTRSATGWPVSGTYDVTVEQITGNPSLYVKFWDSQGSADYSKTWNSDTLYLPPAAPILQQVSVTTYSNKVIYNIKNTVDTEMTSVRLYNSNNELITTLTPNTTSANVEITGLNYNTTISGYYVIATSNTLDSEKLYLGNATTNDIPKFSFRNSNNNIQILWPTSANANLVSQLTYNIKTKDNSGTSVATGTLYYSTVSSSTIENGNYVYTIRSLTSADWDKFANAYTSSYSGNFYVAYNVTVDGTERTNPDSTNSRHYCAATLPTSYTPTFTSSNVVTAKETLSNIVGNNKFLSDNSNVIFSGINKVLIKGNSNNVATAKPSGTTATISSYILSASGKTATVTDWANTGGYLENITTNSINVKAMDSRGYGTTVTKTISKIFPYSKPIFSSMPIVNRVGGVGTTITITIKTKHYIYKQDTNGINGVKKPNQLIIQYKMNNSNHGPTSWTNITTISSYSTNDSELKETTTTIGTLSGVNIPISDTAVITFRLVDTMQSDLDSDTTRRFDPPTYSVNIGTGNVMLWRDIEHHWLGIGKKPTCALDVNGNVNLYKDSGGSWITGRDNAAIKQIRQTATEGSSWNPVVSVKTSVGNWTIGNVGGEKLGFSYDLDSDYNANPKNNTSKVINMPANTAGTIVTTGNLSAIQSYINTQISTFFGNLYPVGSIYITASSSFDPNGKFPGSWSKLTDDAYLKIVSSSPGSTGGQSDHKIGITHLPAHTHGSAGACEGTWQNGNARFPGTSSTSGIISNIKKTISGYWGKTGGSDNNTVGFKVSVPAHTHNSVGGGNAYYPGYYGVYVWKRNS